MSFFTKVPSRGMLVKSFTKGGGQTARRCGGGERGAYKSTIKMAFCDTRVILKQVKLMVF